MVCMRRPQSGATKVGSGWRPPRRTAQRAERVGHGCRL